MNHTRPILLATGNPGKLREVQVVLADYDVPVIGLSDLPQLPEAVEEGPTFVANAEAKARHYARLTNHWALADDSGLEVDALDGAPGVYSARYATQPRRGLSEDSALGRTASDDSEPARASPDAERNDAANNARLIAELAGVPPERRSARFRCALSLADGDRILATASGVIEGRIIDVPRGSNGFGYDPHFLLPDRNLTTAELPPEEKNRISHRGQALRAIAPLLACLLAEHGA